MGPMGRVGCSSALRSQTHRSGAGRMSRPGSRRLKVQAAEVDVRRRSATGRSGSAKRSGPGERRARRRGVGSSERRRTPGSSGRTLARGEGSHADVEGAAAVRRPGPQGRQERWPQGAKSLRRGSWRSSARLYPGPDLFASPVPGGLFRPGGRQDSNLHQSESESDALPLSYSVPLPRFQPVSERTWAMVLTSPARRPTRSSRLRVISFSRCSELLHRSEAPRTVSREDMRCKGKFSSS